MKSVNLSELSEQELLKEAKKQKNYIVVLWVIIGFMVIASVYNTYYQGFKFSMFAPLCFVPILMSIREQQKATQNEIQSRKAQ